MTARHIQCGFTLVELIMVMVLIGIISAVTLPRFFDRRAYDARGFLDQSLSMIRYAQKLAIAQRRDVYVNVNSGGGIICLSYVADLACTNAASAVKSPADQTSFRLNAPTGSSINSSVSFAFTALGRPKPNNAVTIRQTGDGVVRSIVVERETGYVH